MQRFVKYLKKRGFTLIEAIVATIIAGYCLLPVVGTLQSGVERTQRFDHREKLRTLARSRLNKEISVAAFDHTSIDTSTKYHYVYYNSDTLPQLSSIDADVASDALMLTQVPASVSSIVYSYKISVSVNENLNLATTSQNLDRLHTQDISGLKAITVLAELEVNDTVRSEIELDSNATVADSISMFSLINIPSTSDNYIWVSNARNAEIIGVDPESKIAVQNFLLDIPKAAKREDSANNDYRPWHLAVHPGKKFIAYQRKTSIGIINVNKEDTVNFASQKQVATLTTVVEGNTDEKDKAQKDHGLVFRPDGKYCFVTVHGDKKLFALQVTNPDNWNTLAFSLPSEMATLGTAEFSSLHAGSDGWLYLGLKNLKQIVRYPMYGKNFTSVPGQVFTESVPVGPVISIQTSGDGQKIYILWAKDDESPYISCFSSQSLEKLGGWRVTFQGDASGMAVSGDGKYLAVVDEYDTKATTNLGGMYLADLALTPLNTQGTYTTPLVSPAPFKVARPAVGLGKKDRTRSDLILFDHKSREFFFDDIEKPLLFGTDMANTMAGNYTNSIPVDRIVEFAPVSKSSVAYTSRKPDFIAVGDADKTVKFIDTATGKIDESRVINLAQIPVDMALSPGGERLKTIFGAARAGVDTFDTWKCHALKVAAGASTMYKVIIPNEGLHPSIDDTLFCTAEAHPSSTWTNGYWANIPMPGTLPVGYKSANDVDFPTEWQLKDMVALNNGGFLILFKKADGSTMLEWVGRHQWGGLKGMYERFGRWYSIYSAPASVVNKPTTMPSTSGSIDSGAGTITLLKNATFPTGYKITRAKFNSTSACYGRSITPVIVEMSGSTFTIRDIGDPITVVSPTTAYDQPITWERGGKISPNYLVGWWNGINVAANQGVVKWSANAGGLFVSDYGSIAAIGSTIADTYSASVRDYEIQFQGDPPLPVPLFPPLNAQNIAISPDDRFLAIETVGSPNQIHLFDFATNNFGGDTQLDGLVVDYRANGLDTNSAVANLCSLAVSNPTTATGIKLMNTTTTRDTWGSHKDYPGNYYYMSGTIASMDTRRDASKRFFGYYIPNSTFSSFALAHRDPFSLWSADRYLDSTGLLASSTNITTNEFTSFGKTVTAQTKSLLQLNHMTNGGERLSGLFASNGAADVATTIAGGATYDLNRNEASGWTKLASDTMQAFNFKPAFLTAYSLTGCISDGASSMAWSRDQANPVLFFLDTIQDDLWAIKPGRPPTRIECGGAFDALDRQMVVSAASQKLIFAREDNNEVYFVDISDPDSTADNFSFNGTTQTWSTLTGFGKLANVATMTASPKTLVAMPFNTFKSTTGSGTYECVATLSVNISGINNAALASGGIYIMGGAPELNTTATDKIFRFDPAASYTAIITPLVATLTKAIKRHATAAYDDEIFVFNGMDNASALTSWVQKFNPVTGNVDCSYDPPPVPRRVSPPVMKPPTSVDDTNKFAMFGSIKVRWSGQDSSFEAGWKVFDGSLDTTANAAIGGLWSTEPPNPHWVTFDLGAGITDYADTIKIQAISTSVNAFASTKNFKILGSNSAAPSDTYPHADWVDLLAATHPDSGAMQTYTIPSPGYYRHYRIHLTDSYADIGALEYEFWDSRTPVPTKSQMTKTMTDARNILTLQHAAACTTPFGIIVGGGLAPSATSTVLVYWPHGLDAYTDPTNYSMGIWRSLPPLPGARSDHSLVWHKGKIYRMGGSDGSTILNSVDVFNFDTNAWSTISLSVFSASTAEAVVKVNATQLKREQAAACSFGDEIFMFGGYDGAALKNDAVAWNPETGLIRLLGAVPTAGNYAKCAVPYGSSIYLIGGATSAASGGIASIWKFTP